MGEIKDLSHHANFKYTDSAGDDLYNAIMELITEYADQGVVSATDAVGVLEWAKTTLVIMNTTFDDD